MKTPFLGLALLCPTLTFAFANPADSILVKVGKRASVTFYGEKKADLKTLERYDWNAIIRDMNAKLGLTTPAEPRQHYVDLLGNSYLADSSLRKGGSVVKVTEREADKPISAKDAWRSLKSGTQVSFSLGLLHGVPRAYGFSGFQNPSEFRFINSNYFSISLLRNTVVRQRRQHSFSLRWGVEASRMQLRNAYNSEINNSPLFYKYYDLDNIPEGTKFGDISYVVRHPYIMFGTPDSLVRPKVLEERYNLRKYVATYISLPFVPTWTYYDQQGKRTWRFGVGGYVGSRIGSYRKTVADGGDYKKKEYNAWGFNAIRYGLVVNVGYRNVNFFLQKDLQGFFSRIPENSFQPISFGLSFAPN